MDNLTDFDNTKDVSDAAIEWVLRETGSPAFSVESVRSDARLGRGYPADCARILAARLIQRHHPELLVDPDLPEAREIVARTYNWAQRSFDDGHPAVVSTLTAIKRGKELGLPEPVRPTLTREMVQEAFERLYGFHTENTVTRLHVALMEQMK